MTQKQFDEFIDKLAKGEDLSGVEIPSVTAFERLFIDACVQKRKKELKEGK